MGDLLDPTREGEAVLAQVLADMGARAFNTQYQQNPTPTDSDLIRLEKMSFVDELPELSCFRVRLQSWDTASSISEGSKWSVGLTLGRHNEEGRWYLLDVLRAKLEFPELKNSVLEQQARYRPDVVLIENASLGQALLQQFRQDGRHPFRGIQARGSKEERFIAQTDFLQSGRFVLPRNRRWLQPFLQELLAFPEGSCNDQVDALSQACKWIRRYEDGLDNRDPETGRRITMRRRDDPKRW
jgi:predicted phage terminase large subunit-like protein